jgi:regulatory protein YycI of two-component signal transduction system YycFG
MDALINAVAQAFKTENIAIVVLMMVVCFLAWLLVTGRKEDREDRDKMVTALDSNTRAITDLRVALASLGAKQ